MKTNRELLFVLLLFLTALLIYMAFPKSDLRGVLFAASIVILVFYVLSIFSESINQGVNFVINSTVFLLKKKKVNDLVVFLRQQGIHLVQKKNILFIYRKDNKRLNLRIGTTYIQIFFPFGDYFVSESNTKKYIRDILNLRDGIMIMVPAKTDYEVLFEVINQFISRQPSQPVTEAVS